MATIEVKKANVREGEKVQLVIDNTEGYNLSLGVYYEGAPTDSIKKYDGVTESTTLEFDTSGRVAGIYIAELKDPKDNLQQVRFRVWARQEVDAEVSLHRPESYPTKDQPLWVAIRQHTNRLNFTIYSNFINHVLCDPELKALQSTTIGKAQKVIEEYADAPLLNIHGPYAYSALKLATQIFLTLQCGVVIKDKSKDKSNVVFDIDEERYRLNDSSVSIDSLVSKLSEYLSDVGGVALPYLKKIVNNLPTTDSKEVLPYCHGLLQHRFTQPCLLELIWSYWHEEGMMAQTMNAIAMRFQNQRVSAIDPLAELELDPLRPLNNIIWGFIQDEHSRLSVRRRAFEYDHQYGLKLVGRAVPEMQTTDSRSKFIEAFHNLLYRTSIFYREDADTTVVADAFPLLNALKDVHLLLAEGAHNQYGDLPWTARAEMLTQQWMLARPEMREFLRGRHMVPYQEEWMGAVDAMKRLQGWTDTTISHFNELAVDGERLLLSIRFGDWADINNTQEQARNWARYWKPEIQRYLYGYLAVTGVDLMADITDSREAQTRYLQPSALLQRRLAAQARQPALSAPRAAAALAFDASSMVALPRRSQMRALKYDKGM